MKIEVVCARPEGAQVVCVELPPGATLRDAIAASGVDIKNHAIGIFGRRAALDQPLADGDRVEIYRPLALDPKEARRLRARRRQPSRTTR